MLNDHFGYGQSEPHPPLVDLLRLIELAKELEQLLDGFWLNSDSCVLDASREPLPLISECDRDPSLKRELDCVADEIKEDLFKSLHVSPQRLRDRVLYHCL